MPFQSQVNVTPAPAVAGDFASSNPRFSVDAGPGGLFAGPAGVTVGRFCWITNQAMDADNASSLVNSSGSGPVAGIVHREQQALITQFLAEASMVIAPGSQMGVMSGGDYWVKNEGTTQAVFGQKAYAAFTNGAVSFAATASAPTAVVTGSIAATTFSATGSIGTTPQGGSVLTVTAVTSGTIVAGALISGTGVTAGSQIVAQLTGTAGGIGTYAINFAEQTVASTTISGTYGTMTVTAVTSGVLVVGGVLTGTGVTAGTTITALGTGTGGTGTYITQNNTVVASTALTETTAVETKFIAMSSGAVGELVKISDHALG